MLLTYLSSCKVSVTFVKIFMKLEFAVQIFEKYLYLKFHENPSNGSRGVPCQRTR